MQMPCHINKSENNKPWSKICSCTGNCAFLFCWMKLIKVKIILSFHHDKENKHQIISE